MQAEDYSSLVAGVRGGDGIAAADFYQLVSRLCGPKLRGVRPEDRADFIHDVFVECVEPVQTGKIKHPECICGFVWTVCRRQMCQYIAGQKRRRCSDNSANLETLRDRAPNPEHAVIRAEELSRTCRILAALSIKDRQILTMSYLQEQPSEAVCETMDLTATQFRLARRHARHRLADLVHAAENRRPVHAALA